MHLQRVFDVCIAYTRVCYYYYNYTPAIIFNTLTERTRDGFVRALIWTTDGSVEILRVANSKVSNSEELLYYIIYIFLFVRRCTNCRFDR